MGRERIREGERERGVIINGGVQKEQLWIDQMVQFTRSPLDCHAHISTHKAPLCHSSDHQLKVDLKTGSLL